MTHSDAAKKRGPWTLRVYRLGQEPPDDLSAQTTVAQRLEMVTLLSTRMWELTGRPAPSYTRGTMPVKITRTS